MGRHASKCELVTPTELACIFGVSRRWIYDLGEKGMPRDGRFFDVAHCVQWYSQRIRAKSDRAPNELREVRCRLYLAQAERIRLENERAYASLVDREEAVGVLMAIANIVDKHLDAMVLRLPPLVVHERNVARVQELIFNECRATRQAIADDVMTMPPVK